MLKKIKKMLFLYFIVLFLAFARSIFALESKYPNIPGLPVITDNSGLPEFIQYFFGIGIAFAGVTALVSLAIAGVQIIIGQANPEGVSNARDRIKGSLLGLLLLMVSYLIIQTVNPRLTTPEIAKLSDNPGIFYINSGNKQETTAPSAESDTSAIPEGFENIQYRCANPATDPILLVWTYPEKNFKNYEYAQTHELKCGDLLPVNSGKSFKMAFKNPGVYFYIGADCPNNGYRSDAVLTSGELPEEFKNGVATSVEFVNDTTNNNYYGIIFHSNNDQSRGGNCQAPLISAKQTRDCKPININLKSASESLFYWNPEPVKSGSGLTFYSSAYGWDTKGAKAGFFKLEQSDFAPGVFAGPMKILEPSNITFRFDGTGVSTEEQIANPDFKTSPGSIQINGNYLVALYSNAGDGYCQIFNKDIVDMEGTEYIGPGNNQLEKVYIIPIK